MGHIIELNGRKYDALTGKALPVHEAATPAPTKRSVDGFSKVKPHAPRRISNTDVAHHAVHKSNTLMRKSVKKPLNHHGQTDHKAKVAHLADSVIAEHKLPPARIDRAKKTKQSGLIQRFGLSTASLAAAASPVASAAFSEPEETATQAPASTRPSAVEAAMSHLEPRVKKSPVHHRVARKLRIKPRTLSISAAVMAFVVFGGFLAMQNSANLSMRIASMKADVKGSLPSYQPAGFSLNGAIKYQPGEIKVAYKSNSDTRYFEITQKTSGWDTDALRENYVAPKKVSYQTIQEKGKTIYLYDDASATWVDGGVWYTIEGQSELNTQQVLGIASSL